MEESCRKRSSASGTSLPEDFSISQIFNQAMATRSINRPMLQAAIALRKKGKSLYAAHSMRGLVHQSPGKAEVRTQLSVSQGHRSDSPLKQASRTSLTT